MELFASPMACSLASHITALEAGLPVKVRFVKDHKTDDGGDYYEIAANGYVPALRLDDGTILNEGASVLQYLADRKPEAGLAPAWGSIERYQLIDIQNYLAKRLGDRETLVASTFTVADAYLVTLLNWFAFVGCDLKKWPTIAAYHQRHLKRPSVAQAMSVEMAERQRRLAA